MDIIDLLNDAYAFNGDPLFKKARDEIQRLRNELEDLATTTYTSRDDYKQKAREALEEKE